MQFVLHSGQPILVEAQMRHTFLDQPRHALRMVRIALLSLEPRPWRSALHHVRHKSLATFIAGLPRFGRGRIMPGLSAADSGIGGEDGAEFA